MSIRFGLETLSPGWLAAAVIGSAVFYTGAMVAMKMWTISPQIWLIAAIPLAMALGVVLEVVALRSERLGMIYVSILGAEVVLIAFATTIGFGESFSAREIAGCCLVVVGTALAWS